MPQELPLDKNGKHPLENSWVIWYDSRRLHQQGNPNDWFSNLQTVSIFNTVEDFWSTYNHIKRPNDLEFGANYHMFIQNVKPMWEDDANKRGGKWVINISKEDGQRLDELWELLLLSIVGEYLDDTGGPHQICGAVLSKRKAGPRISVWTRDRENTTALKCIGVRLREILKLSSNTHLEYQSHSEALVSGSSYQNSTLLTC
eukprot:NODE_7318_length_790_cov_225.023988_g6709_i0.p1 GENE.NODE_7318_length_790_cov_225.023988_g6709_i0~~NODE_7318_length_790_cov_225.023988_g6709_i0.p1  ORF type:complete len:201 (-),score=26.98 NODE_7318_length_790_cov_225.023988_g6709_i0:127-729(-)